MNRDLRPSDNRTEGLERPFPVERDELERAVRTTFVQRTAVPRPLAADPAGLAIRRAGRIQRRRMLTGLALAAVTTALVSTGMAQLAERSARSGPPTVVLGDPSALPTATASRRAPATSATGAVRAKVDLIIGAALNTSEGEQLDLTGVAPVERAQRVPDTGAWLLTGAPTPAGRTLWWVQRGAAPQVLLAGAEAIALSADGRQVAWRDGGELVTAGIVGTQLIAGVRTPAPGGAVPVRFVDDAVLVRLDPEKPGYALWRPSVEPLRSGADRSALQIYGVRPDGHLVGQVSAGRPRRSCLALLDPTADMAPVRTACGPALSGDGHGSVSTDGRWLLVNAAAGDGALMVDLKAFRATPVARPAGPALTGPVTWAPGETAVYVDRAGALVRLRPGEPASSSRLDGVPTGDRPVVVTGGGS